jgi:Holliday junction resolvase
MEDIAKIQLIHDIKTVFDIKPEYLQELIDQIEKNEYRDNLERFFRGYKIEDLYTYIQGALPWVKLIHGLEQYQFPPLSKEEYQVPDYLCIFEDSKKDEHPVLVEIKSVKGDKQSLELMKHQVNSLLQYADCVGLPIIIAIYWEKYSFWTHVPFDVFEEKAKQFKITIENAFKSDISPIFGDVSFILNRALYRKTIYGKSTQEAPMHEKYGSVFSDTISLDGKDYFNISSIESAIIDALINMKIESESKDNDTIVVIEKSSNNYLIKLSNWVLRHLAIFGVEPNFEYADMSRRLIIDLMKKLSITMSYGIPAIDSLVTRNLFEKAFSGSIVWDRYKLTHKINNTK